MPVFNIKHLREVTPIFYAVANKLRTRFQQNLCDGPQDLDLLDWFSRTALELIGTGGLGFSFRSLDAESHPYTNAMKRFGEGVSGITVVIRFIPYLEPLLPPWLWRRILERVNYAPVQKLLECTRVIWSTTNEIFEADGKRVDEELAMPGAHAASILSVLKKANQDVSAKDRLSDLEMKSQINTLVIAAQGTTSRTLSRIIHLLCLHPEKQDRLRAEILAAYAAHGESDYDQLNDMPYLDAVMRETMRAYTTVPLMARRATEDAVLPVYEPIIGRDGMVINEIHVPKGTLVHIAISAINVDEGIWGPDAKEWKPERWLEPLPDSVEKARVPGILSHQMTFLAGNRSCIGFKFAQLEIKVTLAVLLSNFKFALSDVAEIEWYFFGQLLPHVKGQPGTRLPVFVTPLNSLEKTA